MNGAGGDDVFYVLSSDPNVELILRGGSGDDTFHLGGEHPPIIFDLPPYTYQPPAFRVQDPAQVIYDRITIDIPRITLRRDFTWQSDNWFAWWFDDFFSARQQVVQWIWDWLKPFEDRPFSDILVGDPNDPAVRGLTDDQRANQGWYNGIWDLIDRTLDNGVFFQNISPWYWFWFDNRFEISFDPAPFTFRIGHEELPPPRIVQPAEITVDPPAFAYKLDGVFDVAQIKGKLTLDEGGSSRPRRQAGHAQPAWARCTRAR